MRGTTVLAVVVAVAVLAAGIGFALGRDRPDEGPGVVASQDPATPVGDDIVLASALRPFDDCEGLLDYYKTNALDVVGPYGLGGGGFGIMEGAAEGGAMRATGEEAATADVAAPVGPSATGTNVQEAGVDEPDLVKTDGERALVVSADELQVLELRAGDPRVLGSMGLPEGGSHELLLAGDRVLVLSRQYGGVIPMDLPQERVAADIAYGGTPVTVLTLVDLADPADPTALGTAELDGDYRSARLAEGIARIVIDTPPTGLPFTSPRTGGLREERAAEERNREVLQESVIEDWLPWAVVSDADGEISEGPLLDCERLRRPPAFAGLSTLSVITLDLAGVLELEGATGVVAQGQTVYASPTSLYVATSTWEETSGTDLHAFDISDPATASYVASGSIPGRLLNQYALSEHEGVLRVAVTEDQTATDQSQSSVVVLAARGDELVEVGRADGLGLTETIQSVRFLGDLGVVVTFRQTDPLYTLDLSQPENPRVVGELKVPGFSSYLHPVGDGRLLGIGQDATEDGTVTGVQASLFDVSDPAAPARLDQVTFDQGSATVEYDPRAFLYWPDASLAVVPMQTYVMDPEGVTDKGFSGAVGLRVAGEGLDEAGRVGHEPLTEEPYDFGDPIQRAFVVDDVLYTVSSGALAGARLDDLARIGIARF